ncbi:MAG TPA: hypothetical protein VIM97_09245 [Actinomycetes bacterium]
MTTAVPRLGADVRDGRLLGADMDMLRRDLARRARRLWPKDGR